MRGQRAQRQAGFTLIELLISMVLGLIVIGGVIGVFLSSKQTYRTTEGLSRIQETMRITFELMARDMREAGGTLCGKGLPVANVLNGAQGANPSWFADLDNALRGYEGDEEFGGAAFGTSSARRIIGTDALQAISGVGGTGLTVVQHNPASAQFKVNVTGHGLEDDDVVMVCDYRQVAVLQVTNANPSNTTIVHNTGTGTIGNCSKGLGFPTVCTTNGTPYAFNEHAQIVKLAARGWYVGANGRAATGGRALYRVTLDGSPQEVIDGVQDMQLQYLESGSLDYVDADAVGNWAEVTAVRVTVIVQSTDRRIGTDGGRLQRRFSHVVTLRNRVS